jgi:hypothetical protein
MFLRPIVGSIIQPSEGSEVLDVIHKTDGAIFGFYTKDG